MEINTSIEGNKATLVIEGKLTVQASPELGSAVDGLPAEVCDIDIDFANPAIEHRLWVPDQILGAFSDTALGLKPSTAWQQEWDALKGGVTVIEAKP